MKNLKYESDFFDNFDTCAKKAQELATNDQNVEFDFNGVLCVVSPTTNLEYLLRDYHNSWTMDWKTVGHNCLEKYEPSIQAELERKTKAAELEAEQQQAEYEKREKADREAFELKVKGITIELSDAVAWKQYVDANTDPYGKAAVDYAEGWAKLMQIQKANGKTIVECADETSYELGWIGITGAMYGCAVSMLAQCWKHGEELRKWHNKEYGHEGEGVVNPSVFTIGG